MTLDPYRRPSDTEVAKLFRAGKSYSEIGWIRGISKGQAISRVRRMIQHGELKRRGPPDPLSFGEALLAQRLEADRSYQAALTRLYGERVPASEIAEVRL